MTDDPQTWVFSEGLGWLQDGGRYGEPAARKILGKWGYKYGWRMVQSAIRDARMHNPKHPVSYVQAILNAAPPEVDMSNVPPQKLRRDGLPLPTDEERDAMREKFQALKAELKKPVTKNQKPETRNQPTVPPSAALTYVSGSCKH